MVPDAPVAAPRQVPWWSAVLVFDDGYGMFVACLLVSSFRAVFPFVVARPEVLGILGRYGPEGQLCCDIVDALSSSSWTRFLTCPLWYYDRCFVRWCRKLWLFRSCISSTVVDFPCRDAEAVSHGPDCPAVHSDSPCFH